MQRRAFLKAGSAATLAGLLAGCSSPDSDAESTSTAADSATATADETTAGSGSYSVSMEPVGDVEFDAVPDTVAVYESGYADMVVALGHGDALTAVGNSDRFHTDAYDALDGVSVDTSGLVDLVDAGVTRETLLDLDPDVYLMDPNWLTSTFELDRGDIDFLTQRSAPFLGNTIFRRTDAWHDYDYYSLYEAFETVAELFDETDRFDAFQSFHDSALDRLETALPSEGPRGALVWGGSNEPTSFSPYLLSGAGTNKKPFHDLNVRDAIADSGIDALSQSQRSEIDAETLLNVDPDVLFVRGHEDKTAAEFQDTVVSFLQNHDTAGRITAVENGDVYRGGPIYLGPIQHLFLTERLATALYDQVTTTLFDRTELASIITD